MIISLNSLYIELIILLLFHYYSAIIPLWFYFLIYDEVLIIPLLFHAIAIK